jgi:hypothetical protein
VRIAVILAEFGKPAPDVSQYRECWPEADIQIYGDADVPRIPQFEGPRYGWRANDYFKVQKCLEAGADVAISFDGDMRIVDFHGMRSLPGLAERFGVCLPLNPRYLVKKDFTDGADVEGCIDQSLWYGPSVNCSPIAINLNDERATYLASTYCMRMLMNPQRGPLNWWDAMLATGIAPLILPPQWCVCERHIGIGGEICLHFGHQSVKRHYGNVRIG